MRWLLLVLLASTACAVPEPDTEEAEGSSESALGGTAGNIPYEAVPRSFPVQVWPQPPAEGIFGQNGYCGATAVANLLRLYRIEKSPRTAVDEGCWSLIGTTVSDMVAYLDDKHGDLGCSRRYVGAGRSALDVLREHLRSNRPTIVLFKDGRIVSHYVVVVGVTRDGSDPWVEYMDSGSYYRSRWSDLEPRWSSVYGMGYPMIACDRPSRYTGYRAE